MVVVSGQYVYIEATGKRPGNKFLLLTPDLSSFAHPPYIVTFWYHTFGADIDVLNVYEYDGFTQKGPIWSQHKSTQQGGYLSKNLILQLNLQEHVGLYLLTTNYG